MEATTINNQRYYLHRKVKQFSDVPSRQRTVTINPETEQGLTAKRREWLKRLMGLNYTVQYTLLV